MIQYSLLNYYQLNHLIDILNNIKYLNEPVLLHVTTQKGKGYPPAENNPVYFHGCTQFEIETGNCLDQKSPHPSYTQVFGDTMIQLAKADPEIIAVTAAMPEGTGLAQFSELFPERFFDVGIAEQHGVTFAAGLAVLADEIPEFYRQRKLFGRLFDDIRAVKADLDAAVSRVQELGGNKLRQLNEYGIKWAVMADPDGNEFCLVQHSK